MPNNPWTLRELDYLVANYRNMPNKELAEKLGRGVQAVQQAWNREVKKRGIQLSTNRKRGGPRSKSYYASRRRMIDDGILPSGQANDRRTF